MKVKFNILPLTGYILYTIIAASIVIGNASSASLFLAISYVWAIFVFYNVFQHRRTSNTIKCTLIILLVLSFLNITVDGLRDIGNMNFDFYKKVIMFNVSMLWMQYCIVERVSKQTILAILILNLALACIYSTHYQSGYRFDIESESPYLCFHFPNSNTAGFFLSECNLYIALTMILPKSVGMKPIYRIALIFPFLFILFLTYLTGCRSALLGIVLFFGCLLFDKLFVKLENFPKSLSILWSMFPLIFIAIYMLFLADSSIDLSMGYEVGKTNTTRLDSWDNILTYILEDPIFGRYSGISQGSGIFQSLNTHLDVFVSYGLIPLILYISLLYNAISTIKLKVSLFNRACVYAFLSIIMPSCFEAALVSGSSGLYIACFGYLLMANSDL